MENSTTPDYGTGEKNFAVYTLGIILCVVLTLIPFATVLYADYSYTKTVAFIYVAAVAQFIVQVVCFLRLNYKTEQAKMNVLSFVFSIIVMLVIVFGSLWIMINLNYNMQH